MKVSIKLQGTRPLIMHSERLANPLDTVVKEIRTFSKKRNKTDDDHEMIAKLEFLGGMYWDVDAGPFIPGDNIWRCLYNAAKRQKLGERVKEAVLIDTDVNPLAYKGPRDQDGLWKSESFRYIKSVRVQMARTMRCRAIFQNWATSADIVLDSTVLDFNDLVRIAEDAGNYVGLCERRPRFGRFIAEVKKG